MTVDETNLVCFWDIFTLICIQQIPCQQNLQAEGIVALSNNVIWIYGKRFFQIDTFQLDHDDDGIGAGAEQAGTKQNQEQIYPKES